jgi:hypothetical protein
VFVLCSYPFEQALRADAGRITTVQAGRRAQLELAEPEIDSENSI